MTSHRARPLALVAAALITSVAAPAMAEPAGSMELGLFGGYNWKSANNELGNALDQNEIPVSAPGFGLRLGYSFHDRVSAEFEAKYVLSSLQKSGDSAPILGLRGHLLLNLLTEGMFRPFLRAGAGSEILMTSSANVADGTDPDSAAVFGAGTRIGFTDDLGMRLDLTIVGVPGRDLKNEFEPEAWIGLYYTIGGVPKDTDGDGIVDADDKCLTEKEDRDGLEDSDGCPDPDNDLDGLMDAADKCPDQAEVKNGLKDDDGCPDGDRDRDGIEDSDDKCPGTPETRNGFKDEDGCPDDPDSDGDGVEDSKDKCPKEPETLNSYEDTDGCPDKVPDTDKDGIDDLVDKCPKEPETKNSYQDDDGCPDKIPEKLKKFAGAIKGIEFETGSAKILAKSFALLDNAVTVLKEFKDTGIEISGHTDNTGSADLNKQLSQDRADSVKAYFVEKGIDSGRISTIGFGADRPVADNKKPAGRAKNRRIEFKLM